MRVIPPLEINAARLTSTTAPEPGVGEAAYVAGTSYGIGERVIIGAPSAAATITIASPAIVTWTAHGQREGTPVVLTTTGALPTGLVANRIYYALSVQTNTMRLSATPGGAPIVTTGTQSGTHTATAFVHRTFESVIASNAGNYPLLPANYGSKWLDVGPTNRWAMFDLLRNTATTTASPLVVVVTPGERVNSVGIEGLIADSVLVEMASGGVTVFSETTELSTREVLNGYDYCFAPFTFNTKVSHFNVPPRSNGVITITITRASGPVSCGSIVVGTSIYLGEAQYEAESDALNFSRIERDAFGNSILIPRRSVPKMNLRTFFPKELVNTIRNARDLLNAVPAFWSGLDDNTHPYAEAVQMLGIYKQMSINLAHPDHAVLALEVEEN